MSRMSDMQLEISDYLRNTEYSVEEIARMVGCPVEWVREIAESINNEDYDE